jgi:hypothetical protein
MKFREKERIRKLREMSTILIHLFKISRLTKLPTVLKNHNSYKTTVLITKIAI